MLFLLLYKDQEALNLLLSSRLDAVINGLIYAIKIDDWKSSTQFNHKVDIAVIDNTDPSRVKYIVKSLKKDNPAMIILYYSGKSSWCKNDFQSTSDGINAVDKEIKIRCFGNFEVYLDGEPVRFRYQKAKEMLAYLIDRNGAMISSDELMSVLWEDDPHKRKSYFKAIKSDLIRVFREAGHEDQLIRHRGLIGIKTDRIQCDYYDFLKNKDDALSTYCGDYMRQYSWAEVTHAYIENNYNKAIEEQRKS